MTSIIETNGTTVGEDTSAPAVASLARAKLESLVASGMARTSGLIERVMSEVPEDSVIRGSALGFEIGDDAAVRLAAGAAGWSMHRNALTQAADRAGIPTRYLDSLLARDTDDTSNAWRRGLAQHSLREHFAHEPGRFLIRSVNGQARGFLSDKYRRLDSRPLLDAFVGEARRLGAVPYEGMGSDVRVFLRAIIPTVIEPVPGEAMVLGVEWSNSDYGCGTYSISAFAMRLICLNGMVGANHSKNVHLGGRLGDNIEFSAETYRRDTRTMVSATGDVVRAALGPAAIETQMAAIRHAHSTETNWSKAFAKVSKALSKAEALKVQSAFDGPDVVNLPAGQTMWRFSNALSWVANATEDAERKAELQGMAGAVAA